MTLANVCQRLMSVAALQVLEDVRGIIAEQLGTDLDKVTPDAKFVDLGADSLDTVEIMMALEEKFELQLDEEGAEKISTVQVCYHRPHCQTAGTPLVIPLVVQLRAACEPVPLPRNHAAAQVLRVLPIICVRNASVGTL